MDLHYQKEAAVGTLVLVGIGLFFAGTMWLKGTSFKPVGRTEQVQFADIGQLKVDNAVAVSGVPVGSVASIEFRAPGDVIATITLPPTMVLKSDASAEIVSGFFSNDSRLVLHPGVSGTPLPAGALINGAISVGIFEKGATLADRADSTLIGVQAIANQKTADELIRTLRSLQRVLDTMSYHLPQTTGEADRTMASFRHLADRLDSVIATVPAATTLNHMDTLAQDMSRLSIQFTSTGARLDTLLQKMNGGEGTLGKLVSDSGLYVDSRQAMQALKVLLDELNKHPGKLSIQVKMF